MATTVIVYPSGTTSNSNPHVLFSGGTGATYTIEMTTSGELLFSQDIPLSNSGTVPNSSGVFIYDMTYDADSGSMYTIAESRTSPYAKSIEGFSGSSDTKYTTNYFNGLNSNNPSIEKGETNIIYVFSRDSSNSDVEIKRINTNTGQVTHTYNGGTFIHTRGHYYEYNSTGYVTFGERYNNNNVLTILYSSDLSLVGRYSYLEYGNDSNNYIQQLLYANGKLLWSMPNRSVSASEGCTTAYGTFNLSNNTFTTGSTQSHSTQYTGYQLLDGTQKVYGTQTEWYYAGSSAPATGLTYGYYDYSNDTFTEIDKKEKTSGSFNAYDVLHNHQNATKNNNNGDIFFMWLYDLVVIDGSSGNTSEVVDIAAISSYNSGSRVVVYDNEYNETQNKLWLAMYRFANNDNVIETYS